MKESAVLLALALALTVAAAGCGGTGATVAGGDGARGESLIRSFGCGACHSIPGVHDADGRVGPPLGHLAQRVTIAGRIPNTPDNAVLWIQHPQRVSPGTVMPELGLSRDQARDIAAYLYAH